jgi:hypothetical protein
VAVTLFHKYEIIINNKVTIINGKKEPKPPKEITAKIRGKMYGRRTINRQN